jgi:hypothetical protein
MCGCNLVTPRLIGGDPRSSSGSLAKFTAIRRASSRDSLLVIERRSGWSSKEIAERLAGRVADDEAGVRFFDDPRRRAAARGSSGSFA